MSTYYAKIKLCPNLYVDLIIEQNVPTISVISVPVECLFSAPGMVL